MEVITADTGRSGRIYFANITPAINIGSLALPNYWDAKKEFAAQMK